jgi:hypothetical protein
MVGEGDDGCPLFCFGTRRRNPVHTRKTVLGLTGVVVIVLTLLLLGLPVAAGGPFVEPEVVVIHNLAGEPEGGLYGWAGGDIGDLDGDGAHEFIISDPVYSGTAPAQGKVYIIQAMMGCLWRVLRATRASCSATGYTRQGT